METGLKILGGTVLVALTAFGLILLTTLGGMLAGWVVGLFFTDMILGVLARTGFDTVGLALWQLGGALGFIGSFFKSIQTNTNTAK